MAFPIGWKWKAAITIDKTKVGADQTDYPYLLSQENCPTDAMDADGAKPALDGGGDLIFTSDINGVTRLACDVQQFQIDNNPAAALVEVYVKIPSVSASVNTVFYMWWGNASASQPARNAAYGMEATWNSDYKAVYHLTESWGTTADRFKDATANVKHGTGSITAGAPTISSVAGKWGGKSLRCIDAVSHSKVYQIAINGGAPLDFNVRPSTCCAWVKSYDTQQGWIMGKGSDATRNWGLRGLGLDSSDHKLWWNRNGGDSSVKSSGTLTNDTWTYVAAATAADGSNAFFLQGSASGTSGAGTIASENGTDTLRIGAGGGGDVDARQEPWTGNIDEIRFLNVAKASTYVSTVYNNHNAPGSFSSFGSTIRANTHNDFFSFFS